MGIQNFFFKKTLIIDNDIFGKLEFDRGVWVRLPEDLNHGFMITVCADKKGPSKKQELFFLKIIENIEMYENKAKKFIVSSKYLENTDNLSTYSINIGDEDETINHIFYMEMSDDRAEEIHIIKFQQNTPMTYSVD